MSGENRLTPGDEQLLARSAAGDNHAFHTFVLRHQEAVYRLIRSIVSNETDTEDGLQETFLAAYQGAGRFHGRRSSGDRSGRAWILTIARNKASRQFRRRAGEPRDMESIEELGKKAGWGAELPAGFDRRIENREILELGLKRLSAEEREVLILRELEGFSGVETAEVLDLSLPAMKSRLHRARLELAAALRELNI